MEKLTIYMKLEDHVEVNKNCVRLKDLGKVYCGNDTIVNACESIEITRFSDGDENRKIISVMKVIQLITSIYPNSQVINIGETDTIVKRIKSSDNEKKFRRLKILFVSAVSFFGTAFTIMAFHNDIGINGVFNKISTLILGKPTDGFSVLEVSYSLGLGVGIILFFNHIGGRRITKDPTPIEVEMVVYEKEVNEALIKTADKEGMELDV